MKKKIALLLAAVMVMALALSACTGSKEPNETPSASGTPSEGGVAVVALGYEPDIMNTYSTHLMGDVQATMMEGLLRPDENMEYRPQ